MRISKLLGAVALSALLLSTATDAANLAPPTIGVVPGAETFYFDPVSGQYYAAMSAPGAQGVAISNSEGTKATYSAAFAAITPAASTTDIVTITGSASKTIRITRVGFSCTAGTAANFTVSLVKHSTTDTGGSTTAINAVPHDSTNDPAATATVAYYTTNPGAIGTVVGIVRAAQIFASSAGLLLDTAWDFGTRNGQTVVIRGAAQQLALNLNGVSLSSGVCSGNIEWTEDIS